MSGRTGGVRDDASVVEASMAPRSSENGFMLPVSDALGARYCLLNQRLRRLKVSDGYSIV